MVPVGSGTIAGNLHHLGGYPALTLDGKKKQRVKGTVFALPDDPETLQKIDQYEEYLPNDPSNSLFIRSKRLDIRVGFRFDDTPPGEANA